MKINIDTNDPKPHHMSGYTCANELKLFIHEECLNGLLLSIEDFADRTNGLMSGKAHNVA